MNKMNNTQKSVKIALSGIISALSFVIMLLTGLVPFGTYALPMLAGIIFVAVVIELGYKYAFTAYIVVAVLSIFFAPDKEAVLCYVVILGYYPIIKGLIEGKIKSKIFQFIVKFAVFNIAMVAFYYAGKFILMIPDESFVVFGIFIPYVFLIGANIIFVMYDFAIKIIIIKYITSIRNKIFKNNI